MSKYENHHLNYTKRGQELESRKRTFLTVVFLSCLAFVGWKFYKYYINEMMSRPQKPVNITTVRVQSEEQNKSRFFKSTDQTRNYIDKTPDEISIPEEKQSEHVAEIASDTVKSEAKPLVSTEKPGNQEAIRFQEEKLALIGQKPPKMLFKAPFFIDGFFVSPVTLSWIEFFRNAGFIPIVGTVFSEESSETEKDYIIRDYYYLRINEKSQPRLKKIKYATVKQSLIGKNIEYYEYQDDEDQRSFEWSIKVETDKIVFVNIKSVDVYKITSGDKKYLITKNDDAFAEVVCEDKSIKVLSLIDSKKSVSAVYKKDEDKEKQLYFSLATMLFENNNMNSKLALYLESLRIEELLKTDINNN